MATKLTEATIGVDLNTISSRGLTAYAKQLKDEVTTLQTKQSSGVISSQEKKLLSDKIKTQSVIAHQSKRTIEFYNKLKENGIDVGPLKDLSITSMAKSVESIADSLEKTDKTKADIIRGLANKYNSKTTTLMGTDTVKAVVGTGVKLTGIALLAGSAGSALNSGLKAIGNIKTGGMLEGEAGTMVAETVKDWIATNMPWLKGAIWSAIIGAGLLVAVKKLKGMENRKNMTMNEAMAHQIDAEEKLVTEYEKAQNKNKNITIESEAARAETNPEYLESLKKSLEGKKIEVILAEGPGSKKYTAYQYNAARILKTVQERAAKASEKATNDIASEKSNDLSAKTTDYAEKVNAAKIARANATAKRVAATKAAEDAKLTENNYKAVLADAENLPEVIQAKNMFEAAQTAAKQNLDPAMQADLDNEVVESKNHYLNTLNNVEKVKNAKQIYDKAVVDKNAAENEAVAAETEATKADNAVETARKAYEAAKKAAGTEMGA